jgi:hypothetical protein
MQVLDTSGLQLVVLANALSNAISPPWSILLQHL